MHLKMSTATRLLNTRQPNKQPWVKVDEYVDKKIILSFSYGLKNGRINTMFQISNLIVFMHDFRNIGECHQRHRLSQGKLVNGHEVQLE